LRIAVSDPTSAIKLGTKFGCEPVDEATHLLGLATNLGLRVVGIAFHIGCDATDASKYAEGIAHADRLFTAGTQLGHDMHILDIGGGFPGDDYERFKGVS